MTFLYNMAEPPTKARKMLQLGAKSSYYIVLRRSPIIAGLMQVEIMAIISPTDVGDAGVFLCQSHCVLRSMGVTLSITERLGQDIMLYCPVSHISTPPAPPPPLHNTLYLLFSPSLPVLLHLTITLSACSVSFPPVDDQ